MPKNRYWFFVCVAAVAVATDLGSKQLAFEKFPISPAGFGQGSGWLLNLSWVRFEFHTSLNHGALWGIGQGYAAGFAALSIGAIAGIVWWLFLRRAAESLWLTFALGLVTGGTLGNLYDRLGLHGIQTGPDQRLALAVRDFFYFQFFSTDRPFDWAIFNVADACLVTGAIMLFLHSMKHPAVANTVQPAETAAS